MSVELSCVLYKTALDLRRIGLMNDHTMCVYAAMMHPTVKTDMPGQAKNIRSV